MGVLRCRFGLLALLLGCAGEPADSSAAEALSPSAKAQAPAQVSSLHQLRARTIGGSDQALSAYAGKVVLVVNTASECGFTPQYAELEKLYETYRERGLVVLGFPSNDFGGQEPGSDKEVLSFSQARYGVAFPMFSKSVVKGEDASPVYRFLSARHGEPKWNFHKYLVNKQGAVVAAFPSAVAPLDPALTKAIEAALGGA